MTLGGIISIIIFSLLIGFVVGFNVARKQYYRPTKKSGGGSSRTGGGGKRRQ